MSTTPLGLGLHKIVNQHQQASEIRSGFPTPDDHRRFYRVVELIGLSRDNLGHDRFCAAYQIAIGAAVRLAPLEFLVEAVRDERHVVVGYEFGFADADLAAEFRETVITDIRAKGVV